MKKMVFAVVVALFSLSSFADSSTGCGLGSLIWKDNTIVSALFRITTNHSFSSQLFGITSGTSGCSHHGIVMREMAPIYYAEANLEELKVDMSKGEGEYVNIFSDALGCPQNLQAEFAKVSKENYSSLFPKAGTQSQDMLLNVKNMIKEAPALSGRCSYAVL